MLTVSSVKGLKPKDKPYYEWDKNHQRGRGKLAVQVTPKGSKRFVFRYFVEGKAKFISLGQFPELSLNDARTKQKGLGELLLQGIDPKEQLESSKQALEQSKREEALKGSLKQLFDAYVAQMEKDGKRTYKAVIKSLAKEVYPIIPPAKKAKDVTTHDLMLVLAAMIRRGAKTQSNRVRSYLMAAFNYGLKHDHDPANFIDEAKFGLVFNPVAAIPKQKAAETVGEHFLTGEEVKQLLNDLQNEFIRFQMGDSIRNLIAMCFYTGGQRPYELAASQWSSVNWEAKTLVITSELSKNKRPHLLPLTETAISILKRQQEISTGSVYIFPHRLDKERHITLDSLSRAIARYRTKTEIRPFIPRDIRRTCKTLMGELGISKAIRDRLQNHALQDVSSKHYDRYEYMPEKQRALEAWEQKLNQQEIDNVVSMLAIGE